MFLFMQQEILRFFYFLETPFLDHIAEGITMLGEPGVYILIVALFYWGISKKAGLTISFGILVSSLINGLMKITFRVPRPFETLPELQGKRLETATGYSFPSGHTQGAATFYSTLFLLFRSRIVRVVSILLIILIGLSRLYLGVHWPTDVLGGWIFGIGLAFFLTKTVQNTGDDKRALNRLIIISLSLVLLTLLILTALEISIFQGNLKTLDLFKNGGLLAGSFAGFLLEVKQIGFDASKGSGLQKTIRIILGVAGVFLLQNGLKVIFPDYFLFHLFRYGIMGFWITYLFPLLGTKARLFP